MKKRPPRKLQIENLEDRKLTAAVTNQLTNFFGAPQGGTALVSQASAAGGMTYNGSHAGGFKPLMLANHNETRSRLRYRSARSSTTATAPGAGGLPPAMGLINLRSSPSPPLTAMERHRAQLLS
jgi:hypothetical protein